MSNREADEEEQPPPSQDKLQKRAQLVWKLLKLWFSGVFLFALVFIMLAGIWLFHAFGSAGLLVGAAALVVGLVLLCKHLLTY